MQIAVYVGHCRRMSIYVCVGVFGCGIMYLCSIQCMYCVVNKIFKL